MKFLWRDPVLCKGSLFSSPLPWLSILPSLPVCGPAFLSSFGRWMRKIILVLQVYSCLISPGLRHVIGIQQKPVSLTVIIASVSFRQGPQLPLKETVLKVLQSLKQTKVFKLATFSYHISDYPPDGYNGSTPSMTLIQKSVSGWSGGSPASVKRKGFSPNLGLILPLRSMWPWASYISFWGFTFFICKLKIYKPHRVIVGIKCDTYKCYIKE